jgi:competence protein ComEA
MAVMLAIAMLAVLSDSEAARRGREAEQVIESSLIDINSASLNELDSLPGIGPALAQAIFQARPFDSVEELACVRGIGRKTIERLRPLIQAIQAKADSGQASNHQSR